MKLDLKLKKSIRTSSTFILPVSRAFFYGCPWLKKTREHKLRGKRCFNFAFTPLWELSSFSTKSNFAKVGCASEQKKPSIFSFHRKNLTNVEVLGLGLRVKRSRFCSPCLCAAGREPAGRERKMDKNKKNKESFPLLLTQTFADQKLVDSKAKAQKLKKQGQIQKPKSILSNLEPQAKTKKKPDFVDVKSKANVSEKLKEILAEFNAKPDEKEVNRLTSIRTRLASPKQIKNWSIRLLPNKEVVGQVTNPQTVNYKTLKPEKGGLFCERIFGPVKDFYCACGKQKTQVNPKVCPICGVEFISSRSRRYKLGYIQFISPVTHIWYLKGSPSYISVLLNLKKKKLEAIAYCSETFSSNIKSFKDDLTLQNIRGLLKSSPVFFPFFISKIDSQESCLNLKTGFVSIATQKKKVNKNLFFLNSKWIHFSFSKPSSPRLFSEFPRRKIPSKGEKVEKVEQDKGRNKKKVSLNQKKLPFFLCHRNDRVFTIQNFCVTYSSKIAALSKSESKVINYGGTNHRNLIYLSLFKKRKLFLLPTQTLTDQRLADSQAEMQKGQEQKTVSYSLFALTALRVQILQGFDIQESPLENNVNSKDELFKKKIKRWVFGNAQNFSVKKSHLFYLRLPEWTNQKPLNKKPFLRSPILSEFYQKNSSFFFSIFSLESISLLYYRRFNKKLTFARAKARENAQEQTSHLRLWFFNLLKKQVTKLETHLLFSLNYPLVKTSRVEPQATSLCLSAKQEAKVKIKALKEPFLLSFLLFFHLSKQEKKQAFFQSNLDSPFVDLPKMGTYQPLPFASSPYKTEQRRGFKKLFSWVKSETSTPPVNLGFQTYQTLPEQRRGEKPIYPISAHRLNQVNGIGKQNSSRNQAEDKSTKYPLSFYWSTGSFLGQKPSFRGQWFQPLASGLCLLPLAVGKSAQADRKDSIEKNDKGEMASLVEEGKDRGLGFGFKNTQAVQLSQLSFFSLLNYHLSLKTILISRPQTFFYFNKNIWISQYNKKRSLPILTLFDFSLNDQTMAPSLVRPEKQAPFGSREAWRKKKTIEKVSFSAAAMHFNKANSTSYVSQVSQASNELRSYLSNPEPPRSYRVSNDDSGSKSEREDNGMLGSLGEKSVNLKNPLGNLKFRKSVLPKLVSSVQKSSLLYQLNQYKKAEKERANLRFSYTQDNLLLTMANPKIKKGKGQKRVDSKENAQKQRKQEQKKIIDSIGFLFGNFVGSEKFEGASSISSFCILRQPCFAPSPTEIHLLKAVEAVAAAKDNYNRSEKMEYNDFFTIYPVLKFGKSTFPQALAIEEILNKADFLVFEKQEKQALNSLIPAFARANARVANFSSKKSSVIPGNLTQPKRFLPKSKLFSEGLKSFVKLKPKKLINNYYTVSQTFQWSFQRDWSNFLTYMTVCANEKDSLVPDYLERGLSFDLALTGGDSIRTFLRNFNPTGKRSTVHLLASHITRTILVLNQEIKRIDQFFKFRCFFTKSTAAKSEEMFMKLVLLNSIKTKALRRLKVIRPFLKKSNVLPEWMVLSVLPVLPPALRPILPLDSQQVAVSDLNKLYQTVLFRNKRVKRFYYDYYSLNFSEEMRYAQRLLQESVDALIENGKGDSIPITAENNRPLKSLSDLLKGKKGRFRQNLLGKRVDYSGRSVIVVGPQLKIHECGLPKEMALELFQPFLIRQLILKKMTRNYISAKKLLKSKPDSILEILREVMENRPILLNRAPTLHRLGIQAFQPKLVLGRAILLHPLVCPAFNADFDGDQMAVHVPLSLQACAEAWKLMWSRNNLLSPATGEPIIIPSQDMVLGCYFLTTVDGVKLKKRFNNSVYKKQESQSLGVSSDFSTHLEPKFVDLKAARFVDSEGLARQELNFSPTVLQEMQIKKPDSPILKKPDSLKQKTLSQSFFLSGEALTFKNYYSSYNHVLQSLNQQIIHLHDTIWLRWYLKFELGSKRETALEIRVDKFGNNIYINPSYQIYSNFKLEKKVFYLKTTPGRILMNSLIDEVLV